MSTISSISSGYGLLGRVLADSASVRNRLDTLTRQASDGLISDTYSGLGAGASVSLHIDPQVTALKTGQANIDAAAGRMQVTQIALTQIQSIAAGFQSQLMNLNGLNPSNVDSVAASARAALTQVASLLNAKDGDVYVFSGEDTANPPVPNADTITTSGFFTQIQSAVSQLGTSGAAAITAATLSTARSDTPGITPFSAYLSGGTAARPVVESGDGQRPATGLLANANGAIASTGASTTGSYMRDLMRSLATLGSLTSAQLGDSGFSDVVQDTRTSLGGAISAMAADAGVLGNTQSGLAATKASLGDTITALTGQVSASRDADMASVLSSLTQTQTLLQASYQIIGTVNGLSLVKFLPAS
jgi:flagellar hook-associated protein 3 FlgL